MRFSLLLAALLCLGVLSASAAPIQFELGIHEDNADTDFQIEESNENGLEVINFTVRRIYDQVNSNGRILDEKMTNVQISVVVELGKVYINGEEVGLGAAAQITVNAEVVDYNVEKEMLSQSVAPIGVYVQVDANVGPVMNDDGTVKSEAAILQILVQAQIVEIEGEHVEQIDLKELVISVDENGNEVHRALTVIDLTSVSDDAMEDESESDNGSDGEEMLPVDEQPILPDESGWDNSTHHSCWSKWKRIWLSAPWKRILSLTGVAIAAFTLLVLIVHLCSLWSKKPATASEKNSNMYSKNIVAHYQPLPTSDVPLKQ